MKVPQGKVIAVDSDLYMIRLAKENLVKFCNIEFIQSYFLNRTRRKNRCCIFKGRITLGFKS